MTADQLVRHERRVQRRARERRRSRRRQQKRQARKEGTEVAKPLLVRPGEAGTGSIAVGPDGRLLSAAELMAREAKLAEELDAQQRRMCTRECRPTEYAPGCAIM